MTTLDLAVYLKLFGDPVSTVGVNPDEVFVIYGCMFSDAFLCTTFVKSGYSSYQRVPVSSNNLYHSSLLLTGYFLFA